MQQFSEIRCVFDAGLPFLEKDEIVYKELTTLYLVCQDEAQDLPHLGYQSHFFRDRIGSPISRSAIGVRERDRMRA